MSVEFTERELLGTMLLSRNAVSIAVRAGVRASHYSLFRHSLLHDAIINASIDVRGPVDAITLHCWLETAEILMDVGGDEYIIQILDSATSENRVSELVAVVIRG